jgi:hypothetical protein
MYQLNDWRREIYGNLLPEGKLCLRFVGMLQPSIVSKSDIFMLTRVHGLALNNKLLELTTVSKGSRKQTNKLRCKIRSPPAMG